MASSIHLTSTEIWAKQRCSASRARLWLRLAVSQNRIGSETTPKVKPVAELARIRCHSSIEYILGAASLLGLLNLRHAHLVRLIDHLRYRIGILPFRFIAYSRTPRAGSTTALRWAAAAALTWGAAPP